MYHYTYKITFVGIDNFYFGVRSCSCQPEYDSYLGSPTAHKKYWINYEPIKTIISKHTTREEAGEYEKVLINWSWSIYKDLSLNATDNAGAFNLLGTKQSEEHKRKRTTPLTRPFMLVSPTGEVITGTNLSLFARDNSLDQAHLCDVINGNRFHYKEWTASLEAHKLYKQAYLERGMSFCNY